MVKLRTTVGQILVNEALPEELRDYDRALNKKGLSELLGRVAKEHPDRYREISKRLADIGRRVATESGGYGFTLSHLRRPEIAKQAIAKLRSETDRIINDDRLTDQQRKELLIRKAGEQQKTLPDDVYKDALAAGNPLALQIASGTRGNPGNLASLLAGDLLYADQRGRVIPVPVTRSYAEGLTPAEYWAGTYGARRGLAAVKLSTAQAGFFSKGLNRLAHRLLVTDVDAEEDDQHARFRGFPADVSDADNEGALLARPIGPYDRNTVLTPKILKHLQRLGHEQILVRSPAVGGPPGGGLYGRDVGVRDENGLPGRGSFVGHQAAQAIGEPISQNQLGAKHAGGVAGADKGLSGFPLIDALVQSPETFPGMAGHAEADGPVTDISAAPAGGYFVTAGGVRNYVPAGRKLKVSKGDTVEAGDLLSDGAPNHKTIVAHKGIGEGRRYFVNAMRTALSDAGMKANRRNLEIIARGLIDHVRLTGEMGQHVPDDVVPYQALEHTYEPRADAATVPSKRGLGKYLEKPVLHYTIGTRVRPSVLKDLQHFGIDEIHVHNEPPPFEAEMIRGADTLRYDPDWLARQYGSGLKGGLLDAVYRGGTADESGTSFVPGLVRGVDFGKVGPVQPVKPPTPVPPDGMKTAPMWRSIVPGKKAAAAAPKPAPVQTQSGADQQPNARAATPGVPTRQQPAASPSGGAGYAPGHDYVAGTASANPYYGAAQGSSNYAAGYAMPHGFAAPPSAPARSQRSYAPSASPAPSGSSAYAAEPSLYAPNPPGGAAAPTAPAAQPSGWRDGVNTGIDMGYLGQIGLAGGAGAAHAAGRLAPYVGLSRLAPALTTTGGWLGSAAKGMGRYLGPAAVAAGVLDTGSDVWNRGANQVGEESFVNMMKFLSGNAGGQLGGFKDWLGAGADFVNPMNIPRHLVGLEAGGRHLGKKMIEAGGAAAALPGDLASVERLRAQEDQVAAARRDAALADYAARQAAGAGLSGTQARDQEELARMQAMSPAERETHDLNTLATGMHNMSTRSIARPSELLRGQALNPWTSRRIGLTNLGGWLPW